YNGQANAVEDQIVITSDDFSVEESSSRAVFTGNVIIVQPDLKVWANKVIVYYGENGPSDIKSLEVIGKVKIKQPEQTAFSDRGVYDPKTEILKLFGNVKVVNDSGTITGAELIVDIKNGTSRFPASQNGKRVTAIFSTQ
ncbi:MAG: lipopolysaccharide transport periplasmic protein LptA, partial [Devosiaceae bacterium]|nr:lipopolysaccharide transport periplasmic protein LptA [Devosiaceae bacterium]